MDSLTHIFNIHFDTQDQVQACMDNFKGEYDNIVSDNTKYSMATPYFHIDNTSSNIKKVCKSLKSAVSQLQSLPLTGAATLSYTIFITSNDMLNEQYANALPKGEVTYKLDKELTDMVSIRTHLKELDKIADNILKAA